MAPFDLYDGRNSWARTDYFILVDIFIVACKSMNFIQLYMPFSLPSMHWYRETEEGGKLAITQIYLRTVYSVKIFTMDRLYMFISCLIHKALVSIYKLAFENVHLQCKYKPFMFIIIISIL